MDAFRFEAQGQMSHKRRCELWKSGECAVGTGLLGRQNFFKKCSVGLSAVVFFILFTSGLTPWAIEFRRCGVGFADGSWAVVFDNVLGDAARLRLQVVKW